MIGGVFFYSYTIGTITSLMADMNKKKVKLDRKLTILQDIEKKYLIGRKLFKEIKSALEYDKNRFDKEKNDMIGSLPRKLALQLNFLMNKKLVEDNNKFFENKPIPFINMILHCLKPLRFKSKDNIYYKNEYSVEMYFISKGQVSVYDTYNGVDITFETLTEGDYFGDVGIILSEPYESSVKALRDSEFMALTRDDLFNKIVNTFDENIKADLVIKASQRRDAPINKRQKAINEYIRNKNIVKSIYNEKKFEVPQVRKSVDQNIEKNLKKIKKIRNTLSPKTLNMLDFTKFNEIDRVRVQLELLKNSIQRFDKKFKENKLDL